MNVRNEDGTAAASVAGMCNQRYCGRPFVGENGTFVSATGTANRDHCDLWSGERSVIRHHNDCHKKEQWLTQALGTNRFETQQIILSHEYFAKRRTCISSVICCILIAIDGMQLTFGNFFFACKNRQHKIKKGERSTANFARWRGASEW